MQKVKEIIKTIPKGYSEVIYQGRKYSLICTDFNGGKSLKIFAKQLGGRDFISFNYYATSSKDHLKPCEMPVYKVVDFLMNIQWLINE